MFRGNDVHKHPTLGEQEAKVQELKSALHQMVVDDAAATDAGGGWRSGRHRLYCSDECLRRYLKARNWNVKKAESMLRETLKWRETYKPEEIKWEDVSEEFETGKMYRAYFTDKLGRPVIIMTPRLQNSSSHDDQIRQLVYMMENACFHLPEGEEKFLWIIDFEGWSIKKATPIKTVKETARILQSHYPERLAIGIMLNAPKIFEYTWKLWKPFIDPVTYQKAQFIYTDDDNSSKIVKEIFGENIEMNFDGLYDHNAYGQMMRSYDVLKKSSLELRNPV